MEHIETTETSDIFLSAFFLAMGSDLLEIKIVNTHQNIASFLIAGNNLSKLDKDFASGKALVNPVLLRSSLNWLRDVLFEKLRKNNGRYENDRKRKNRVYQEHD